MLTGGGEGNTGGDEDDTVGVRLLECSKWFGSDDLERVEVDVMVEEEVVEVEAVLVREAADRAPLEESRSLLYSR